MTSTSLLLTVFPTAYFLSWKWMIQLLSIILNNHNHKNYCWYTKYAITLTLYLLLLYYFSVCNYAQKKLEVVYQYLLPLIVAEDSLKNQFWNKHTIHEILTNMLIKSLARRNPHHQIRFSLPRVYLFNRLEMSNSVCCIDIFASKYYSQDILWEVSYEPVLQLFWRTLSVS